MEAFTAFIGEKKESVPFHYHRLEVYARQSKESLDFVPLDQLKLP